MVASKNTRTLNVHEFAYQEVLDLLRASTGTNVHGTEISDWIFGLSWNTVERTIRRLVAEEVLVPLKAAPTVKQLLGVWLLYGLRNYRHATRRFDLAFGLQTHFRFTINRYRLLECQDR